jgi:hypothetical protein
VPAAIILIVAIAAPMYIYTWVSNYMADISTIRYL